MKKLDFVSGNANWLSELTSVFKQCNNTIHRSIKMSLVQASEKPKEKEVYSTLQDKREKQKPNFQLGQLGRWQIFKVFLVKMFQQIGLINYKQ